MTFFRWPVSHPALLQLIWQQVISDDLRALLNSFLKSGMLAGHVSDNISVYREPHRKKSSAVRSGMRGSQLPENVLCWCNWVCFNKCFCSHISLLNQLMLHVAWTIVSTGTWTLTMLSDAVVFPQWHISRYGVGNWTLLIRSFSTRFFLCGYVKAKVYDTHLAC